MVDLLTIQKLVINLDSRKDRLEQFDKDFKSFFGKEQSYTRISAIKGKPPKRFIAASHKKAIQHAKDLGLNMVCIMEDDVMFTSKNAFAYAQSCFQKKIPSDWSIILGGTYNEIITKLDPTWIRVVDFSGLHFYVIRKEAYDIVLGMNTDMHIDRWIASREELHCYRTKKIFALQRNGYSDNTKKIANYGSLVKKTDLA